MQHLRLDLRLLAVAVALALAVAGGTVSAQTPTPTPTPTKTPSPSITDPTGVFCSDMNDLLGQAALDGIQLTRFDLDFDPNDGNPNDVAITSVSYVPDGGASCQNLQNSSMLTQAVQTGARPALRAKWNAATDTMSGTLCQENVNFGTVLPGWTRISVDWTINANPKVVDPNAFTISTAQDPGASPPSTCTDTGSTVTFPVPVEGRYLDGPGGPGAPKVDKATFDSDWDKDKCRDWDELAATYRCGWDPFFANDIVGGIAELPDEAGTALEAAGGSDGNAALITGLAAGAAAGALALGGVALYLRRRRVD